MSARSLAVGEALYVSHLLNRIRPNRMVGYSSTWARWVDVPLPLASASASWPRWMGIDLPLRMAVFQLTDVLLEVLVPGWFPESLDRDVLRVQVCHQLRDEDRPPLEIARRALALRGDIPRTADPLELSRWVYHAKGETDPAAAAWRQIIIGTAYVP